MLSAGTEVSKFNCLIIIVQALLGVPQFWLNFGKKNTCGLSATLIFMWLFGDMYKMFYYSSTHAPTQLLMCSVF